VRTHATDATGHGKFHRRLMHATRSRSRSTHLLVAAARARTLGRVAPCRRAPPARVRREAVGPMEDDGGVGSRL
jgi:hypothetical protein